MTNFTTEARRHGEESGSRKGELTAETRRRGESCGSSDFFDQPMTCDHPITPSPSTPASINKVMQTIRAVLREIFDESAYDRFLLRTHASRSVASYRAFTRERDESLMKKPRCC